jgi:hypothetical protein
VDNLRHYYHVYASGAWAAPVAEHTRALGAADFPGDIVIGLVGEAGDRERARQLIELQLAAEGLAAPRMWVQAEEGFEQLTLAVVRESARAAAADYPVLYCHTKGARNDSEVNTAWRRSMTARVVGGWRQCVGLLGDHDTVGCHWITPQDECPYPDQTVDTPFYGGNFWWARSSYLATLPEPWQAERHDAEAWIGLGAPRACDLLPGWPSTKLFAP